MSKVGETKDQITRLLGDKRMTLTEISHSLDLAPSTVSQHLRELAFEGKIRMVDSAVKRKWKYYEAAVIVDGMTNMSTADRRFKAFM